jgi:hypothetical protein
MKKGKRKNGKSDTRNKANDNCEVVMNKDQIAELEYVVQTSDLICFAPPQSLCSGP